MSGVSAGAGGVAVSVTYAIGIDPGASNGAAVVLDVTTGRAVACVAWTTPSTATKANPTRVPTVWEWDGWGVASYQHPAARVPWLPLRRLVALAPDVIGGTWVGAVEAVAHYGVASGASRTGTMPPARLIVAAEAAGQAAHVLHGLCHEVPLRPASGDWRRVVGITTRSARDAARQARAMVGDATAGVRMPVRVAGLPPELAKIDHVADAALIALWASITSRAAARRTG